MKRRHDATPGFARDEYFYSSTPADGYDGLDRLTVHRISGGATVTVAYDQKGNITNKSDVGNYAYSGYGPHAVSAAGIHSDYAYDANGNMYFGGGRTIEWSSFNQAKKITDNASGKNSEFFFGAAHERVRQVRKTGTNVTDTTIYIGTLYEKVTTQSSGLVEHKHYIVAPTGRVAVFTDRSNFTKDTRFFHTDGLGSITAVTDEGGRVLKRYTYDAWGKQSTSYTNNGSGITNQAPSTRGFTDHEMLSDHGLVHMNGRVYDPVLGRVLSADPNVDGEYDSQGYNRYSYVENNPLSYTDPSGYLKFKNVLKIVAVVAIAYWTGGLGANWLTGALALKKGTLAYAVAAGVGGGTAAGFSSGFAGSLLNGGSVGDAFKAGVIGGISGGLAGGLLGGVGHFWGNAGFGSGGWAKKTLAHGLIHGARAEATGGKFRHGFYAGVTIGAFESEIANAFPHSEGLQYVAAAVVGGTAAVLGGDKFANGAISAAFSYMFNQMSTKKHRAAHSRDLTDIERKEWDAMIDALGSFNEDPLLVSLANDLKKRIPRAVTHWRWRKETNGETFAYDGEPNTIYLNPSLFGSPITMKGANGTTFNWRLARVAIHENVHLRLSKYSPTNDIDSRSAFVKWQHSWIDNVYGSERTDTFINRVEGRINNYKK